MPNNRFHLEGAEAADCVRPPRGIQKVGRRPRFAQFAAGHDMRFPITANCLAGCLIADYASVREESTIGQDTIVGRGTVVENKVKVGFLNYLQPIFTSLGS